MTRRGTSARHLFLAAVLFGVATGGASAAAAPAGTAGAPVDTVRTNLWLTEALMADAVAAVARVLPAPPQSILLEPRAKQPEDELLGSVLAGQLAARGYELYKPAADDEEAPPATDLVFGYRVTGIDLVYPEVGRTLGIWREWVDRRLTVSILVEIVERGTGRVVLNDRVTRSYSDRVPGGDFDDVNSRMYDFTHAATSESAWQRRLEEIVVLSALAGLVAIYFANTSN
jgi:hypothetical protein